MSGSSEGLSGWGFESQGSRSDASGFSTARLAAVDVPAPPGPALDDSATAAALRRYRRRARVLALVGTVVLVAFAVVVSKQSNHAKWLLEHGAKTPGIITSVSGGVRGGGSMAVTYDVAGVVRHGTINLTGTSGYYAAGSSVVVIYAPGHPSDIRTPQEQNLPNSAAELLVIALVVSLFLLVGGLVTVARARRWRRLLAGSSWQAYQARYLAEVRRGRFWPLNPGLELVGLDTAAGSVAPLRVASSWRWRTERLRSCNGKTLWVAGDPAGRVVLAIPATRELYAAAAPRAALAGSYAAAAGEPVTANPGKAKKALRTVSVSVVAEWALVCTLAIWQTDANDVALALIAVYTVAVAVVLIIVRRAYQKPTDESTLSAPLA